MIVCVKIPCPELKAAFGRRWRGQEEAAALVTDGPGGTRVIGEVSAASRTRGIKPGMTVGRAIGICPGLLLAESDPVEVGRMSEGLFLQLEHFGADLECGSPGEAFFHSEGLEPLCGGLTMLLEDVCGLVGRRAMVGAGPSRLAALASVGPLGSPPDPITAEDLQSRLDAMPIDCLAGHLGDRGMEEEMRKSLERLGVMTLGEMRMLGRDAIADRFGEIGLEALEVASGIERPLRPRRPVQPVGASIDLWDQAGVESLHRALVLLCSRVAEGLMRLGKSARSLMFEADLSGGGSWRRSFVPRQPTGSERLFNSILSPALEGLPAPPSRISLEVRSFADRNPEQIVMLPDSGHLRNTRLDQAARQVEETLGCPGLMRVIEAEPLSPLPERRLMLVPHLPGQAAGDAPG